MKPAFRYLILLSLAMLVWCGAAVGQDFTGGKFPVTFGPTNLGKEFYFSFPTNYEDPGAAQQYIRLYIAAPTRTRVSIYTGPVLKRTLFTEPNDVVIVDLTKFEAQALSRANNTPVPPDAIYRNKAVHMVADEPIVVYGINRTSYTSDGMLILPVNAIGNQYVIASATDAITGYFDYKLPSQYLVTAAYDNTVVTITNPMKTPNHAEGQTFNINLNKGDVFSAMSEGAGGDLSGATIYATKPVAVTAGQNCTFLPDGRYWACDHLEEMLFPVSSWGTIYHSVPFATRLKGDLYRIFAAEDNTDVFINGVKVFTLSQRGGPEGTGWISYLPIERMLYEFRSNKPIMVAQYNNSQDYDNVPSDPFYLVLTPVEQYQTSFIFTTPAADFAQNYVNLVAEESSYSQIEIAKAGTNNWQNLSRTIPRAVRNFTTQINGKTYVGVYFDIIPGTYKMRGPLPFAAYIYGFGTYDSYGYPLSAAVKDLTTPDTIAPEIKKTQDCYGNVAATVTDLPEDPIVRSNLSTIDLDPEESFNYRLVPVTKIEEETPSADVRLEVVDPLIDAKAVIVMTDQAGNESRDTVIYAAFKVEARPSLVDFGTMFNGTSANRTLTLRNLSGRKVTIQELSFKTGGQGFTIVRPATPFDLDSIGTAGSTIEVEVRFDATKDGAFVDSLTVRDVCGLRPVAELRANVGTPVISVSDFDFEAWPLAAPPKAGRITITNSTTTSGRLTVTGVAKDITDKVIFSLPSGLPFTFPLVLAPGEFRTINVQFKPTAVQAYLDSIVFSSNAPSNPANDSVGVLNGRGIQGTLVATDFDWGRQRVGTGPYTGTVTLSNIGTSPIQLNGIGSTTGNAGDFAVPDPSPATRSLGAGETVNVDVTFTPTATGPREVTIVWAHTPQQSEPVESHLTGFGTEPALVTEDYDFGSMNVGATPEVQRTIVFRLPPPQVPDVLDSVKITGFTPAGDADFRMDPVATPIVMKRGGQESVSFIGYFGAQAAGVRNATVTANTVDGVDATSRWTGVGISQNARIEGEGVSFGVLCADERTMEAKVWNSGDAPLTISVVNLSGLPSSFSLNPPPSTPITLAPGDTLRIPITFTATGSGLYDGMLQVSSSDGASPILNLRVQGATIEQTVGATVVLAGTTTDNRAEFGRAVRASVKFDNDIMAALGLRNYRVRLTWTADQFNIDPTKVAAGSANPGATFTVVSSKPGELVLDVASPSPITSAGEVLSVPMWVPLGTTMTRALNAEISAVDVPCLTFAPKPASIDVVPICGLSVRLIEMNATTYALSQNTPNPVGTMTKISYSLGLDGQTTMRLFDDKGNLVQVLIDEVQQPGVYEASLDVSQLPSGLYYYTLTSGAWSQTRSMLIAK